MSRDIHTQHTRHLFNVCHKDNTKKSKRLSNRQHQSNTSVPVLSSLFPPPSFWGIFPSLLLPPTTLSSSPLILFSSPCPFASYYISPLLYFTYPSSFPQPSRERKEKKRKGEDTQETKEQEKRRGRR